jgi:hypothetical protein
VTAECGECHLPFFDRDCGKEKKKKEILFKRK